MRIFALLFALAAAAVVPAATRADNPGLVGTVGPGYTISLEDASGKAVDSLAAGTYDLVVHDRSDIHNFHLFGTGLDVTTTVEFVGDRTFTITVRDGVNYSFVCDPHSDVMHGKFSVGAIDPYGSGSTVTPTGTATAKSITAKVGPGRTLAFPSKLARGKYVITVRDSSKTDNVHLRGPGVDRKTGVAFEGTAKWTVTLKAGRYRAWSDAHKSLARTLAVT